MSGGLEFAAWLLLFLGIAIAAAINEYRDRKRKNVLRKPFSDSRDSITYFRKVYGLKDWK